jgi:hypothetical protein
MVMVLPGGKMGLLMRCCNLVNMKISPRFSLEVLIIWSFPNVPQKKESRAESVFCECTHQYSGEGLLNSIFI